MTVFSQVAGPILVKKNRNARGRNPKYATKEHIKNFASFAVKRGLAMFLMAGKILNVLALNRSV
jgi:hypothetical protein